MKTYTLTIQGMSCGHCIMAVKKELSKISAWNVKEVKIGSAVVEAEETPTLREELSKAIEEAGYSVVSIQ